MIWVAGRIVEDDVLKISVRDRTFEHGLGLFETLRTWNGRAPLLDRHLARMERSAKALGIPLDLAAQPDQDAVTALLEATDPQIAAYMPKLPELRDYLGTQLGLKLADWYEQFFDVVLRITLTGGFNEVEGSTLWMRLGSLPPPIKNNGAVVELGNWVIVREDPTTRHKILNYWARRHAYETARALGYDETLSCSEDWFVWEGSRTNLFLVSGDALITPSSSGPIVPGIMRGLVIEQGHRLAMTVVTQHDVVREQLMTADEVFLTNSVRGIIPVARIGEKTWPAPGDWTQRLSICVNDWLREQGETSA
jgi:branched-subunit amino acid aminotransferase/4-amino-4-deoxychorismate lyase